MAGAPGLLLLTNEQHSYGFTAVSFIKPFWHLLSQLTAMMKRILGWHLEDPRSNLVLPQEPIMSLRESLFFSLWNGNNTFFTKQLWGLVMLTYIKLLAQCLAHTSHSIYDSCHSFYKSRKIFEPQSTAQLCSSPFFNNLLFNDGKHSQRSQHLQILPYILITSLPLDERMNQGKTRQTGNLIPLAINPVQFQFLSSTIQR